MRVVCDNCGAVYKIPDEKLVKPVNKATCRACGHRMLIPRPPRPDAFEDEERTLIKERPLQRMHPPMMADGDRQTAPIEQEEPEETLPRGRAPSVSPPPPRAQTSSRQAYGRTPVAARPRYPDATPPPKPRKRPPPPQHPVFGQDVEDDEMDEETVLVNSPLQGVHRHSQSFDPGSIAPDEQPTRPARPPTPPRATPRATPRPEARYESRPATPRHESKPEPRYEARQEPRYEPRPEPSYDARQEPRREQRRERTPPPVAERSPPPAPSRRREATEAYDPAGDMTMVALGIGATLFGVLILGLNIPTGIGWFDALLKPLLGLVLAFGGLFTGILLLITGGRGRRPAWRFTSLLAGTTGAMLVAGGFAAGSAALQHYTGATTLFHAPAPDPSTATVLGGQLQTPEPEDAVVDTETEPEPEAELETVAVAAPVPPAPTVDTRPAPRPSPRPARPSPRPAPAPVASPRPAPAPEPRPVRVEPKPEPEPVVAAVDTDEDILDEGPILLTAPDPAPAPDTLETVPMEALDVMLRNNLEVKKCFFTYMQAEGSLPARVDVRFTLEPSGKATGVSVTQAAYAGTDLETCLRGAIGGITFPPSQSSSKITYPFIFQ